MDELTRINQLDNELRDNKFKKLQIEEQIKELEKQREDLDNEYERKKESKIELEKDRYKSKKLRRKIVEYGKKSSLPEVALKLEPYVNTIDWSKEEIPEEILDGFVRLAPNEQAKQVGHFCETLGAERRISNVKVYITDEKLDELKRRLASYVDDRLETFLMRAYQKSYSKNRFYSQFWGWVLKSEMFEEKEERAFALYDIFIDKRIPYYPLKKGLTMDEKTFDELRVKNANTIRKLRFILLNSFSQKTEEASLLLNEIQSAESDEEKVVLFAWVLDELRREGQYGYIRIRDIVNEILE